MTLAEPLEGVPGKIDPPVLFSVIVPTYRRPEELKSCLQRLVNQSLHHSAYEVLIVDNDKEGSGEPVGPLAPSDGGGEVIRGMFQSAAQRAAGGMLLYLNSDILLDDSGAATVRELGALRGSWLGSAPRWCLPPWSGEPPDREEEWQSFFKRAQQVGRWGEACALDLFLIRGLSFASMPPFFIGHRGWDNWMILHARQLGVPVLDLSRGIRVIHCDHDYSYAKGNSAPSRRDGLLEDANLRMLGGEERLCHLGHATHEWRKGAVRACQGWGILQRNMELWQIRNPGQSWWWRPLRRLFHPLLKAWQARTTREEDWNISPERIPTT
jgi:hypothetical protein